MSNRERWTVYPLLFLTLGISLRDKITDSVVARSVRCEELVVAGADGKPRVQLVAGGPSASGALILYGQHNNHSIWLGSEDGSSGTLKLLDANGKTQIIAKSVGNAGAIETLNALGEPQIVLRSNDRGGNISAVGNDHNVVITMGHEPQGWGLFARNLRDNVTFAAPMLPQAPTRLVRPVVPGIPPGANPPAKPPTQDTPQKEKTQPPPDEPVPAQPKGIDDSDTPKKSE